MSTVTEPAGVALELAGSSRAPGSNWPVQIDRAITAADLSSGGFSTAAGSAQAPGQPAGA